LAAGLESRDRKRLKFRFQASSFKGTVRQGCKCESLVNRFLKDKSPPNNLLAWKICLSDFLHQPSVLHRIMRSSCHMELVFTFLTSFRSRRSTWPISTVLAPCNSPGYAVAADKGTLSKGKPLMYLFKGYAHVITYTRFVDNTCQMTRVTPPHSVERCNRWPTGLRNFAPSRFSG
jgi:hypothetical protein